MASLINSDHDQSELKNKITETSLTLTEQFYKKLLTDQFELIFGSVTKRRSEKDLPKHDINYCCKKLCSAELLICNDKLTECEKSKKEL